MWDVKTFHYGKHNVILTVGTCVCVRDCTMAYLWHVSCCSKLGYLSRFTSIYPSQNYSVFWVHIIRCNLLGRSVWKRNETLVAARVVAGTGRNPSRRRMAPNGVASK